MTKTRTNYCPVCYANLEKVKEENGKKKCPNCGVNVLMENDKGYVRCKHCLRLFADIWTYKDHLNKKMLCTKRIPIAQKLIRTGWLKNGWYYWCWKRAKD